MLQKYILGIILLISVLILIKFIPVETETKYFHKKTILYLYIKCVAIVLLSLFDTYDFTYIMRLGIIILIELLFLQK